MLSCDDMYTERQGVAMQHCILFSLFSARRNAWGHLDTQCVFQKLVEVTKITSEECLDLAMQLRCLCCLVLTILFPWQVKAYLADPTAFAVADAPAETSGGGDAAPAEEKAAAKEEEEEEEEDDVSMLLHLTHTQHALLWYHCCSMLRSTYLAWSIYTRMQPQCKEGHDEGWLSLKSVYVS